MVQRIDVRKCNAEKNYTGDLAFEFEGDNNLIDIPFVEFSSPVTARLHYEILEDDSVEVTGEISFTLKGACSRCLSETEQRITGEADACFVPENPKDDEYLYRNVVDLSEFLRDALLIAMPSRLLCEQPCVAPNYRED